MKPCAKLFKIDSFPYTKFAGIYRYEAIDDSICVKSKTGYLIIDYFPLHLEKLRHALIRPYGSCSIVISMCESGISETKVC